MISIHNTFRPRQTVRHFADDIFKCIFVNGNVWISLKMSLKFVPMNRINIISTLVHFLNQWWLVYWRIYASLGLTELNAILQSNTPSMYRKLYYKWRYPYIYSYIKQWNHHCWRIYIFTIDYFFIEVRFLFEIHINPTVIPNHLWWTEYQNEWNPSKRMVP